MPQTPFVAPQSEVEGLSLFIDVQRQAILEKSAGLSEEQARSHPTASDFCMLTLVKHVAFMERRWFQLTIADRDTPGLWPPADPGEELRIDDGDTIELVRALYQSIIDENREILAAPRDLDPANDYGVNKRWVLLHVLEELARHAGHADLIRESIDGVTGV